MLMYKRIEYLDVAKGLLILIVIFHHSWMQGYEAGKTIHLYTLQTYASWFIPAFFVITGYCSNFDKPFRSFLVSNLCTLIWPAITSFFLIFVMRALVMRDTSILGDALKVVPLWGFNWFLSALFFSKIIYWVVRYHCDSPLYRGIVLLTMAYLAIWMNDKNLFSINWFHHRHAIYLTFWLYIGEMMRQHHTLPIRYPITVTLSWALLTILCMKIIGELPGIGGVWINFSVSRIPLHILLSILGTLMVISFSKVAEKNQLLSFIGRNSLVFYLFHSEFLKYAGGIIISIFHPNTNVAVTIACLTTIFLSILGCTLLVQCFSQPKLKWLMRL